MKLFQYHKDYFESLNKTNLHYQFLIFKNKSLFHLIFEKETPHPYTGIRIWFSLLDQNCLFSVEFALKGYALSFYLFSNYWEDYLFSNYWEN